MISVLLYPFLATRIAGPDAEREAGGPAAAGVDA
jgi:hypothetical protein